MSRVTEEKAEAQGVKRPPCPTWGLQGQAAARSHQIPFVDTVRCQSHTLVWRGAGHRQDPEKPLCSPFATAGPQGPEAQGTTERGKSL